MKTIRIKKSKEDRGFEFDVETVFVDLFHLLSIFLADERLAKTLQNADDPLWWLCSYGEREITRILVNSAIVGRIIDERDNFFLPKNEAICGELTPDVQKKDEIIKLTLREAFNKIIHAIEFELIISNTENHFSSIQPRIILVGEKRKSRWEARLDIIDFIREYVRYFRRKPNGEQIDTNITQQP